MVHSSLMTPSTPGVWPYVVCSGHLPVPLPTYRGWLISPLAGAMAARGTAAPHAVSRRDRSGLQTVEALWSVDAVGGWRWLVAAGQRCLGWARQRAAGHTATGVPETPSGSRTSAESWYAPVYAGVTRALYRVSRARQLSAAPRYATSMGDQHTIAEDSWHWVDKEVLRIQIISIENDHFYHIFLYSKYHKDKSLYRI